MKISCIALVLTLSVYGCTSTGVKEPLQFTQAPLLGMIYDTKSSPVTGAEIIMDGAQSSLSDINGKVVLYGVTRGEHSFVIRKKGFEEVRITLNFSRPTQVLYTTLTSMETILEDLKKALSLNELKKADLLRARAGAIDADNARLRYLDVVYLVKMKKYSDALRETEILRKRYPDSSPLVLTEAKIFLFGLKEKEKALRILESIPSPYLTDTMKTLIKTLKQEKKDDRGKNKNPAD